MTSTQELIKQLQDMDKEGLCTWMPKFIAEVRHADGNEYTGETLYQIVCALQRHLRANGREVDFLSVSTSISSTSVSHQKRCPTIVSS